MVPNPGAVHRHIRQREVRMVEDIEELRAELQVDSLADPRRLHHGEIGRVRARPDHRIASRVAKRAGRRRHECRRIEPGVRPLGSVVGVAHHVGPVVARFAASARARAVPEGSDRQTAAQRVDAAQLPACGQPPGPLVQHVGEDVEIVDEVHREPLALVEAGSRLFGARIETVLRQRDAGRAGAEAVGGIVDGVRPDMRSEQRQALGEAPAQHNLQRVVIGIGGGLQLIDAGELRIDAY